jgi:K+-transporting ATPase A subunit
MDAAGWVQLALIVAGLVVITKPFGIYLVKVLDPDVGGRLWLERRLGPVERLCSRPWASTSARSRPGSGTRSRWSCSPA